MTDLSTADSARIVAGFKAYYAGLALPEQAGNLYRLFVLKYAHSWKVARLCRVLAVGQGWDDGSVRAGTALGLLHDIARFAQLKVFGHFVDTQSIDHGRLGEAFLTGRLRTCEDVRKLAAVPLSDDKADLMLEDARVLSGFDFLGGMNNDTRAAVLAGIRLHNQRNPSLAEFGPNERMMIELIRDADKLDNMSMISNQMWHGNASLFSEMPYLTDRHEVRPEVTEQVQAGRLVGYDFLETKADYLVCLLGWINDLNLSASGRILKTLGFPEVIRHHLPETDSVRAAYAYALARRDRLAEAAENAL